MTKIKYLTLDAGPSYELVDSVCHSRQIVGLTHTFYRYPARFSPLFPRAAIRVFTKPGDVILDPFMGGGTSLVEAKALGRKAVGVDISSLSNFVTRVKTRELGNSSIYRVQQWSENVDEYLNLRNPLAETEDLSLHGYTRNLEGLTIWPIKKSIALAIQAIPEGYSLGEREFIRCAILKTGQWALDGRKKFPSASAFRSKLTKNTCEMLDGMRDFKSTINAAPSAGLSRGEKSSQVFKGDVSDILSGHPQSLQKPPKLIVTSPPYPGVHVLYHRWQVNGGRETPAPFWIANELDGKGLSYYTFGGRHADALSTYYSTALNAFRVTAQTADSSTILCQLIAFSQAEWQLPEYLAVMEAAGFEEYLLPISLESSDGRLWRDVPNRKWHATKKGATNSSKEVVLFHKLANN